jgi:hypothetical protein
MRTTAYRAWLLALYQLTVATGILLMPVAMLARRVGLRLPMAGLIDRLDAAYESASATE